MSVRIVCIAAMLVGLAVAPSRTTSADPGGSAAEKIRFDLAQVNEQGLYGPPDGLRALHYEFCIPASPAAIDEVQSIDPTVAIHPRSPGRAGCAATQALMVGSSHQAGFRDVLQRLASLPYIDRIDACSFE